MPVVYGSAHDHWEEGEIMRAILLCALLLINTSVWAAEDSQVYGDKHCFHFSAPAGWVAEHMTGESQGSAFVLYPANSTLSKSAAVINVRVADKSKSLHEPKDQVAKMLQQFHAKYKSPHTKAQKVREIKARSGAVGEMYKFTGDKRGNTELAVYFSGKHTINFFVMTSRDTKDLDNNRKVLEQLAKSYREASDCRSCDEPDTASSCKTGADSIQFYGIDSYQPLINDKKMGK